MIFLQLKEMMLSSQLLVCKLWFSFPVSLNWQKIHHLWKSTARYHVPSILDPFLIQMNPLCYVTIFKIHFNIDILLTIWSLESFLYFRFSKDNLAYFCHRLPPVLHVCFGRRIRLNLILLIFVAKHMVCLFSVNKLLRCPSIFSLLVPIFCPALFSQILSTCFTFTNTTIEIIVSMTYSIWNVEGFCGQSLVSCFWRRNRKHWQVIYVKSAMGKMASADHSIALKRNFDVPDERYKIFC